MALSHAVAHAQALRIPMKGTLGKYTATLKYIENVEINKVINVYDHLIFTSRLEAPTPIYFTIHISDGSSHALVKGR
jgi:hypothetical protein